MKISYIIERIKTEIPCTEFLTPDPKTKRFNCPFCGSGTHHGAKSSGDVAYYPNGNYCICYSGNEKYDVFALIAASHGLQVIDGGTTKGGYTRKTVKGKDFIETAKIGMRMLGMNEDELDSELDNRKSYDSNDKRLEKILDKTPNYSEKEKIRAEYDQTPKDERDRFLTIAEAVTEQSELRQFLDENFAMDAVDEINNATDEGKRELQEKISERIPNLRIAFTDLMNKQNYSVEKIEELFAGCRDELVESDFYHYLKNKDKYTAQAGLYDNLRTGFANHKYTEQEIREGKRYGIDNILIPRRGVHVLAAQSSMGKTTFALNLADNYATQGQTVIYITTEMNEHDLYSKSLNRLASTALDAGEIHKSIPITTAKIKNPSKLTDNQKESLQKATEKYLDKISENMHVVKVKDRDISHIHEIIDFFVNYHRYSTGEETSAPIIFIDYLQLLKCKKCDAKDRRLEVDAIMETLEEIRDKYDCCIYLLSSVGRSNYGKKLDMDAAKESGEIESTSESFMTLEFTAVVNKPAVIGNERAKGKNKSNESNPNQDLIDAGYKGDPNDYYSRKITLCFKKNRDHDARGTADFKYYPMHDYFEYVGKTQHKKKPPLNAI